MSFEAFAAEHGLIIGALEYDKWVRVPTQDHPHRRNGAYIFNGQSGAVQNWAIHEKPIQWRDENQAFDYEAFAKRRDKARKEKFERQRQAAKKAATIMKDCKKDFHPYLVSKGFPNDKAWVRGEFMYIPMRIDDHLVGCQVIDAVGGKKFISGQVCKGATAVFENKGVPILCEGYATAMSIRRALKAVRKRYKVVVCFSAGNLIEMAKKYHNGLVVADTDKVGIQAAQKTELPYWVSDVEGEDFNDAEMRVGSISAGEWLLRVFRGRI